jgi:hypothetical protein
MRCIEAGNIAMFIGAALNHPLPPGNGNGLNSTIYVSQYKTKFDEIRIYCTLAYPQHVQQNWKLLKGESAGEISDSFRRNCLLWDAKHYRNCYLSMINLLGNTKRAKEIKVAADYPELLFLNEKDLVSFLEKNLEKSKTHPQYIESFYSMWGANDFDSLKKILIEICGFSVN